MAGDGAAPAPGAVEACASADGWAVAAALPGVDGRLIALDSRAHPPDPEFERAFLDVAALAAARLAAEDAEADAERAQDEYRLLFENSGIGIYRASMDGAPVRTNPELVRMNGYDTEAEMLSAFTDAVAEWSVDLSRSEAFLHELNTTGRVVDFVCELYRHKTRERMWVTQNAWLIRDATGAPIAYEGTVVDASGRRRTEERIAHMARHDALTGLPNRPSFVERLEAALAERGPDEALAVMLLDLDRFKAVNDSLGHSSGDALLRVFADRIAALLGPRDVVARLGGDEFALFVPGAGSREAVTFVWRLRAALAEPVALERRSIVASASIGIALAPGDGADPSALLRAADLALYSAKAAGRDGFRRFVPAMDAAALDRARLEDDLHAGVERGAFRLSFEPVADLDTGRTVAFEALLGWADRRRGPVAPEVFLPVAEETGAIVEIGAWALPLACAEAADWPHGAALWIKVSPAELASPGFEATLAGALASSGLAPARLVIELGEAALTGPRTALGARLARLRALGVRVALDDFGAGQAALRGLRRFRFELLKLDPSFVADLDDPRAASLVAGLVDLGRRLGLATVAEGVATEAQRALLRELGCAYGQGPGIGAPVDAAAAGRAST